MTTLERVQQAREVYTKFSCASKIYYWDLTPDGRLEAKPYAGSVLEKMTDAVHGSSVERVRRDAAKMKTRSL